MSERPKREVLGKEYFCLEEEVLRVCCEVSSSAIPIKSLLKCNQLNLTYHFVGGRPLMYPISPWIS